MRSVWRCCSIVSVVSASTGLEGSTCARHRGQVLFCRQLAYKVSSQSIPVSIKGVTCRPPAQEML